MCAYVLFRPHGTLKTFLCEEKTHLDWSVQYSWTCLFYLHPSCDETVRVPYWRQARSWFLLVEIKLSRIGQYFGYTETLLEESKQSYWPGYADFKSTSPFASLRLESSDAQNQLQLKNSITTWNKMFIGRNWSISVRNVFSHILICNFHKKMLFLKIFLCFYDSSLDLS